MVIITVWKQGIVEAMAHHKPMSLGQESAEVTHVAWDDIGGLEDVKALLREVLVFPIIV
jgi:SpoVK/Ycf46/Vps4 family AAA+-type ATPase